MREALKHPMEKRKPPPSSAPQKLALAPTVPTPLRPQPAHEQTHIRAHMSHTCRGSATTWRAVLTTSLARGVATVSAIPLLTLRSTDEDMSPTSAARSPALVSATPPVRVHGTRWEITQVCVLGREGGMTRERQRKRERGGKRGRHKGIGGEEH